MGRGANSSAGLAVGQPTANAKLAAVARQRFGMVAPEAPPDMGSEAQRRREEQYLRALTGWNVSLRWQSERRGGAWTDMRTTIMVNFDRPRDAESAIQYIVMRAQEGHEAGHLLYTDPKVFEQFTRRLDRVRRDEGPVTQKTLHRIWNSLEDGMLEERLRTFEPGTYKWLSARNLLDPKVGGDYEMPEIRLPEGLRWKGGTWPKDTPLRGHFDRDTGDLVLDPNGPLAPHIRSVEAGYTPVDADGNPLDVIQGPDGPVAIVYPGTQMPVWTDKPVDRVAQMDSALLAAALPEYEVGRLHPDVQAALDAIRDDIDAAVRGNTADCVVRAVRIYEELKRRGLVDREPTEAERDALQQAALNAARNAQMQQSATPQLPAVMNLLRRMDQQQAGAPQQQNSDGSDGSDDDSMPDPMNGTPQMSSGAGQQMMQMFSSSDGEDDGEEGGQPSGESGEGDPQAGNSGAQGEDRDSDGSSGDGSDSDSASRDSGNTGESADSADSDGGSESGDENASSFNSNSRQAPTGQVSPSAYRNRSEGSDSDSAGSGESGADGEDAGNDGSGQSASGRDSSGLDSDGSGSDSADRDSGQTDGSSSGRDSEDGEGDSGSAGGKDRGSDQEADASRRTSESGRDNGRTGDRAESGADRSDAGRDASTPQGERRPDGLQTPGMGDAGAVAPRNAPLPPGQREHNDAEGHGKVTQAELDEFVEQARRMIEADKATQRQADTAAQRAGRVGAHEFSKPRGTDVKSQQEMQLRGKQARGTGSVPMDPLDNVASQMAAMMQRIKAEGRARTTRRRHGRLDSRRFASALAGDPKVFYRPGRNISTDAHLIDVIDVSGSVSDRQRREQYLASKATAIACERAGIKYSAIAYHSSGSVELFTLKDAHSRDISGLDGLMNCGHGGTPTAEGVEIARAIAALHRSDHTIINVQTDGGANDVNSCRAQVEAARLEGYIVQGQFYGTEGDAGLMDEQFGRDGWKAIANLGELPRLKIGMILDKIRASSGLGRSRLR
jgi:hypothetical protein